jgi:hypothetical protein
MRYLVISACADLRTGKEFEAGDEFLPEPDQGQALRLVNAGCLRVIPDDAPRLPGTDGEDALVADLQEQLRRAGDTIVGLNQRLTIAGSDRDALDSKLADALKRGDTANDQLTKLRGERDQLAGRVEQLTADLAEATKPTPQDGAGGEQPAADASAETPGKAGKAKA